MKRNKFLRTAAIVMALVLITTCGMVGTLAKYVEGFTSDTKTVRAGVFWVKGDTTTLTFDAWEGDGLGPDDQIGKYGTNETILVPGMRLIPTKYAAAVPSVSPEVEASRAVIENLSEVAVRVQVTGATISDGWDGLLFSIDGSTWEPLGDNVTAGTFIYRITRTTFDLNDLFSIVEDSAPWTTAASPVLDPLNGKVALVPKLQVMWRYHDGNTAGYMDPITYPGGTGDDATPIAVGAYGKDGAASTRTDTQDTAIGIAQAKAHLTGGAGYVADAPAVHAGTCTINAGAPGTGVMPKDINASANTCVAGCVDIVKFVPGTYQANPLTPNKLSISFTVQAVQVD